MIDWIIFAILLFLFEQNEKKKELSNTETNKAKQTIIKHWIWKIGFDAM